MSSTELIIFLHVGSTTDMIAMMYHVKRKVFYFNIFLSERDENFHFGFKPQQNFFFYLLKMLEVRVVNFYQHFFSTGQLNISQMNLSLKIVFLLKNKNLGVMKTHKVSFWQQDIFQILLLFNKAYDHYGICVMLNNYV